MFRISKFKIGGALLLLFLGAQCLNAAWSNGQTTDESFFSASGYPIVRYNDYRFLGEHPPLTAQLGGLPLLLVQPEFPIRDPLYVPGTDRLDLTQNGLRFLYKMGNDPHLLLFLQRLPIVGLTVLLGLMLFMFAGELYGGWGALLALALYCFSPDIIAHGSLFTTDMGITVFYFLTIYALKRFFDRPTPGRSLLAGVLCGLAFVSKISGLILLPVTAALFLVFYFTQTHARALGALPEKFDRWLGILSLFVCANAIGQKQAMVLWGPLCLLAVYLCFRDRKIFSRSRYARFLFRGLLGAGAALCFFFAFKLKKKYGIQVSLAFLVWDSLVLLFAALLVRFWDQISRISLTKLFLAISVVAALVIILDYTDFLYKFHRLIGFGNFSKPLGIVLSHSAGGHRACVEGSFITCDWRYFFGVLSVKTPLLTLILFVSGLAFFVFSKRSFFIKSLVILPPAFFLGAAVLNGINIGVRHILPVYPFIFLIAGIPGALLAGMKKNPVTALIRTVFLALLAFSAARTILAAPDYLAYFNELVGGPAQGAKLVGDSNLNWGQDNRRLAEFVREKRIPFIKIMAEAMNADIYDHCGIRWELMKEKDLSDPEPGFYALGIGAYTAQQNDPRSWFKGRPPHYRVGKTVYIFEVSAGERIGS